MVKLFSLDVSAQTTSEITRIFRPDDDTIPKNVAYLPIGSTLR
jgi:hypothetical protein